LNTWWVADAAPIAIPSAAAWTTRPRVVVQPIALEAPPDRRVDAI